MGLPSPIHPLSGHCSIINDQTLYTYSPSGFQSLELKEGAEWEDMPMGISVTGGQCVKAVPEGDPNSASLYIVGGSVNETAATWGYPGLQRYSFAQKTWEWVRPVDWVTQNRQNHAAVYLNASQQILVYSGSQTSGDNGPSSSTFLISTVPPYAVQGYSSAAPPAVKPMLMPWDANHAVMFGGGPQNEAVFLFSPEGGWQNLGVTLTEPITNQETVQCTVMSGDDGSKVLERFDMSVNPNKVSRYALLNQGGTVAAPGTTVGDKKAKRDLTISEWPAYNGTFAPTVTRTGYSIAQDSNGVAVISGGNQEDPLCIFDQKANAWVNATKLFAGEQIAIQSTPSASPLSTVPASSAPSASASSTAEAAVPAAAPSNNKSRMLTVLGATLGAILGIAAILILLLFCLKYRREKKKKAQQSGYIEKDRLSFADRGAEFMSEAGGSVGQNYSSMNASQSSLAIISGRTGMSHKRGLGPLGSDASTTGLVTKKSPLGYADPVEMSKFDMKPTPVVAEKTEPASKPTANIGRSRSSGWSRYFANNEATNLAHMPSGRSTYASDRTSTGSQSLYTNSRMYSQPSQTVPPLDLDFTKFDGQRLTRVVKGSPTLGHSEENLPHQPMQAELARANSNGSSRSGASHDDHYARAPVESWTPMGDSNYDRPPSSNYTNSVVVSDQKDGTSSYYPDGTSSFYPRSEYSSFYPGQPRLGVTEDRGSTVTVFPRGIPENSGPPRQNGGPQQDMSWLNLGAGK
ncbi:hypothetical protein K469DRAFT_683062 [Zopfia rhizophila CBS 207.26]|uniref:Galactose oxidase n=1 Tax=Zopfia rhizophila CBS 207.26 TaxID=1314779 RepID=A0A6A6EG78_9PEZI|nr:hypothetical protein K469DRAFT_683062 [Zopfia rhizophila CBS 207.26]